MEEKPIEIKQVSEREIWIGEHRLYLGEDNILYLTLVGEMDEEFATKITEAGTKLIEMTEGIVHSLTDVNKVGKPSAKARKILSEAKNHERTGRYAIFGAHPVARVLASFFMGATKKKDMRFFKTREEALAWLKE